MQETLVSFKLLLKEFASNIVAVGSGFGRNTKSVTTVPPVPAPKHAETLTQKKKRSESRQIHCTSSQSYARIGCLLLRKRCHRALIGTSDASLAYVRSAKSEGRLRNSCLIHPGSFCHRLHRFRLLSPKNKASFCCVAEGRLSLLTPLAVAHFLATKPPCTLRKTLCVILTEDLVDPMAQRVAIRISFRS